MLGASVTLQVLGILNSQEMSKDKTKLIDCVGKRHLPMGKTSAPLIMAYGILGIDCASSFAAILLPDPGLPCIKTLRSGIRLILAADAT